MQQRILEKKVGGYNFLYRRSMIGGPSVPNRRTSGKKGAGHVSRHLTRSPTMPGEQPRSEQEACGCFQIWEDTLVDRSRAKPEDLRFFFSHL
jgi:hypothetical protein